MQNTDNLRPLIGRPGKKKRNRNRTQQPAFVARPMRAQNTPNPNFQPRGVVTNLVQLSSPKTFQAPHHQQESMVELTDDTAPNVPLTNAGWKPIIEKPAIDGQTPTTSGNETNEVTPTRQEKWMKFQETIQKKLEKKAQTIEQVKKKLHWVNPTLGVPGGKQTATDELQEQDLPREEKRGQEIHWELNTLDEKEEQKTFESTWNSGTDKITIEKEQSPIVQDKQPITLAVLPSHASSRTHDHDKKMTIVNAIPTSTGTVYTLKSKNKQSKGLNPTPYLSDFEKYLTNSLGGKGHRAGVPKTFLTMGALGAIQPQQGTVPGPPQNVPSWSPNTVTEYETHVANPFMFEQNPTFEQNNEPIELTQQYSPSDVYEDTLHLEQDPEEGSESSEAGQKRLSAFQRLGPLTPSKKPKLTINLMCNKDQSVREVVDETEMKEKYVPVHLRPEMQDSADETVLKYLPAWPWKKNVIPRKSVTARTSKSAMMLEQEQMEEAYEKDNIFFQVTMKGYPPHWRKEHVLDVILDCVRGKSFIPCFTEFTEQECRFLVIRSRAALLAIHKLGFYIRKDDVELGVTISQLDVGLNQLDFIPRLILRKRIAQGYDGERKLSLKEFTTKFDISHFIYFPLNRSTNQSELVQLQSIVAWDYLTDLDLSHNRITSLDSFDLPNTTPKLKHLDLSFNSLEKVTALLRCRELSLKSLKLEGNPLCHDYTDPRHYVRVAKMMFPTLMELDDIPIHLKGDLPTPKKNFCLEGAYDLVDKFLEVFFPLLDSSTEDRMRIEDLYDEKAIMTVTYKHKLRYSPVHRFFRNLFLRARMFEEGEMEAIEGAPAVAKLISKWPPLLHDPHTFTVDVLHHSDSSTILRVNGLLKLIADSLAEDEPLLAFTRTLVLTNKNGAEYKILNEMVYWDEPTEDCANSAFQINSVRSKRVLSLKFDTTPNKDLRERLTEVFMQMTDLDKKASERCLETKDWNLKIALEYFMKILKLDDLNSLRTPQN